MRAFTTVELVSKIGAVTDAALQEPVAITHHRKPKFVLMAMADYERLKGTADPRRAYRVEETPDEILALFAEEVAALGDVAINERA